MNGNGQNKGKASIFDKIKKLMNATESEELPIEEKQEETDGGQIDINDAKNGYKEQNSRPIMEEIFSGTEKKIKTQKINPLEYDNEKSESVKSVVHLHEVKLEDIKKDTPRQPEDVPGDKKEEPVTQEQAGKTDKDKTPAKQEPAPDKPVQKAKDDKPVQGPEDTKEQKQLPACPAKEGRQAEEKQADKQAENPSEKAERAEQPAAEKREKPVPKADQPERLEKDAALQEKSEDETFLAKFSGKFSAFLGFINHKPDEFAPDAESGISHAEENPLPAAMPADSQPVELSQKKHTVHKTSKTPAAKTEAQTRQSEKDGRTAVRRQEKSGAQKKNAEPADAGSTALGNKSVMPFSGFEKMSVQKLPPRQLEKLVVNGMRVPEYIHDKDVNKIILSGDKIQHTIKKEYEEYFKTEIFKEKAQRKAGLEEKPQKVQHKKPEAPAAKKQEPSPVQADTAHKTLKEKLFGSYENAADYSSMPQFHEEKEETIEDYERPGDARAVRAEINMEARKLLLRSVITAIAFVLLLVTALLQKNIPGVLTEMIPNVDIMFCFVNFLLLALGVAVCHITVINGLKPLLSFRGNSDTAVAAASIAAIAQGILSFFDSAAFFGAEKNLYALLILFALFLNSLGKLTIERRIRDNFKFISAPNRKYAVKIVNDEETADKMLAGTKADKPVIAFQRRTKFLKNFLKLSYTPDPSEKTASKFAPVCIACAVLVAIVYGIIYQSVPDAISALTVVSCIAIPVCCLLAVNIPMRSLCRTAVKNNAMIIGYPAVKQFCDTRAVMVDSRELYPRGRVDLLSVKTFNAYNIDKAFMNAAAVLKVANTPMTYMFEDVICDKGEQLPPVESVKYEDGKGLVCWVTGERLLLGTRELMAKYSIELPSLDFEQRNKESDANQITYLANAGQLVAMLVTGYKADKRIVTELKRLENNGVSILVRTADPNVTQESVAKDFKIYFRSIKILPTSLGNICKEEMSQKEESSRAYISTRGKIYSLARAVAGCIKIKNNISIAIVVQFIAVVLGMLLVSTIVIAAGLKGLGCVELLLYMLFWTAASIIAPMLQKP